MSNQNIFAGSVDICCTKILCQLSDDAYPTKICTYHIFMSVVRIFYFKLYLIYVCLEDKCKKFIYIFK
jgi:hypothetical protein